MGLFSFKKKSGIETPMALDAPEDLPPLPPLDNSFPGLPSMNTNPAIIPSNFHQQFQSMPPLAAPEDPDLQLPPATHNFDTIGLKEEIDDDVNHLFIPDNWQEPDWANYQPYVEPEIEPPTPEDFGVTPEPEPEISQTSFEQPETNIALPEYDTGPVDDIQEAERKTSIPLQLYVKGTDYRNVFSEITRINEIIIKQDPKSLMVDSMIQKEDEVLNKTSEHMESLYKRLNLVDKKLFG